MKLLPIAASVCLLAAPLTHAATQFEIDRALAPVTSPTSLQATLSQTSPLDVLGDELPAFIASITFDNAGVSGFDVSLLANDYTATEVYRILTLFGMQTRINEYPDALVYSAADKLLLENVALPLCDAASPIKLKVIVNKHKQAKFRYKQGGVACDGNVAVTENTTITYQLKHGKRTPKGLKFTGAGFTNPFDAHIKRVTVSQDGQQIALENNIDNQGTSKFQFIFSSEESDLLLVSPDPQIKNEN